MHLEYQFYGDQDAPQGYAYMARSTRKALKSIGVDLSTPAQTILLHSIPWHTFSWYSGQRAGISSMWEHSVLPTLLVKGLERFDFAVVPCEFSANLFRPHVKDCYIVPLGIDPEHFYPPKYRRRPKPQPFTILSAGTNLRKGVPDVVEGFRLANIPNSRLILKGKRALELMTPTDNETVIVDFLDTKELRELYWSADMYISGSRGEGWDMIAFEALACGVPTVVPAHTSYLQWGHLAQGWLNRLTPEASRVTVFGDAGVWQLCDPVEISEAIVDVYTKHEEYKEKAKEAAETMAKEWTWESSARQLVDHLSPLNKLESPGIHMELENLVKVKCLTGLNTFDIGGYAGGPLREGATYIFPAEVGRVLTDSGYVRFL